MLLISWWNEFWCFTVVPKYIKCATFSKEIWAIFMLWFCPAIWWRDTNITWLTRRTKCTGNFKSRLSRAAVLNYGHQLFLFLVFMSFVEKFPSFEKYFLPIVCNLIDCNYASALCLYYMAASLHLHFLVNKYHNKLTGVDHLRVAVEERPASMFQSIKLL